MLRGEAIQVYNDMLVWDAKKFGQKVYYKNNEADDFILRWRDWFSKYYQGCSRDGSMPKEEGAGYHSLSWWYSIKQTYD